VRAAVAIARRHLSAGDRVGVVLANPDLYWQRLGTGRRQLVRIVDTVVDARRNPGFVRPTLDRLPNHLLTPGALVVCLSPLLGQHATAMIAGVFRRGHPTVVIDVLADEPDPDGSAGRRRAVRLWRMEREAIRFELASRGVLVLPWPAQATLAAVLAPVTVAGALSAAVALRPAGRR
jgi:uncharacterized protein (DUF58 family)